MRSTTGADVLTATPTVCPSRSNAASSASITNTLLWRAEPALNPFTPENV